MKTLIAAFRDNASAQQALTYLQSRNIRDAQRLTDGPGLTDRLRGFHVPEDKVDLYAEMMKRGAPVIIAKASDDDAGDLANQLDQLGSLDIESELAQLHQESTLRDDQYQGDSEGARDLEVVEEKVRIGKRAIDRGSVRVRTYVIERPVEEQVELHDERIEITREAVDERVSPDAVDLTLTEDEFVVTAQGEEAVVGKEARVVERVHVGKHAETHTETVRATERRKDVDVEPIESDDRNRNDPRQRRP